MSSKLLILCPQTIAALIELISSNLFIIFVIHLRDMVVATD